MKGSSTINRFIYHLGFPHLWGSRWSYHIDIVSSFASGGLSRDQTDQTLLVPRKPGESWWKHGGNKMRIWWKPGENLMNTWWVHQRSQDSKDVFFWGKIRGWISTWFLPTWRKHGKNMVKPKGLKARWNALKFQWFFKNVRGFSDNWRTLGKDLVNT